MISRGSPFPFVSDSGFRLNHPLPCTGCVNTHVHMHPLQSSAFLLWCWSFAPPDGPRNSSRCAEGNPDFSRRLYPCKDCASKHFFAFLGVKPNCCLPEHPGPSRKFWGTAMAWGGVGGKLVGLLPAPSQFPISSAGFREPFHPACFAPTNTSTSLQSLVLLLIPAGSLRALKSSCTPGMLGLGGGTSLHDLGSSGDLGSAGTETRWGSRASRLVSVGRERPS